MVLQIIASSFGQYSFLAQNHFNLNSLSPSHLLSLHHSSNLTCTAYKSISLGLVLFYSSSYHSLSPATFSCVAFIQSLKHASQDKIQSPTGRPNLLRG